MQYLCRFSKQSFSVEITYKPLTWKSALRGLQVSCRRRHFISSARPWSQEISPLRPIITQHTSYRQGNNGSVLLTLLKTYFSYQQTTSTILVSHIVKVMGDTVSKCKMNKALSPYTNIFLQFSVTNKEGLKSSWKVFDMNVQSIHFILLFRTTGCDF